MWDDVLHEKASDLDLIASWASQVGMGDVRDLCRQAAHRLRQEAQRRSAFPEPDGRRLESSDGKR